MDTKKILIISGDVPATTFIDALVNAMAEEGFKMTIVGKKNGTPNYHKDVNVIITPTNKLKQIFFIFKNILKSNPKDVNAIIGKSKGHSVFYNLLYCLPSMVAKPDKVHIQWGNFLSDIALDLFSGKVLLSLRGAHINYTPITNPEVKALYLRLFPKVHRFHAVSDTIGIEATKYDAPKERIQTIYSFVSDDLVNKQIAPKEKTTLKIISIGRFHWKKGYDYALDALCVIKQKKINFIYTIVAQGNIPDDIIFQVNQLGLNDHVVIINGLKHKDVLKKIEENDLLLLSSVEEGIANVVLEAMAVGTPVVTTDCGGMNEVITNNVSGIVVSNRDTIGIANAIETFEQLTATERFSLAVHAKKRINDFHNKKAFVAGFTKFYTTA